MLFLGNFKWFKLIFLFPRGGSQNSKCFQIKKNPNPGGGGGGQKNYGLFPLFVTFSNSDTSLSHLFLKVEYALELKKENKLFVVLFILEVILSYSFLWLFPFLFFVQELSRKILNWKGCTILLTLMVGQPPPPCLLGGVIILKWASKPLDSV